MFAQIIRGNVSDSQAVDANFGRWSKELAPGAKGWLGTTGGVTHDGQLFIMVRFESEEAARANSERRSRTSSGRKPRSSSKVNRPSKTAQTSPSRNSAI